MNISTNQFISNKKDKIHCEEKNTNEVNIILALLLEYAGFRPTEMMEKKVHAVFRNVEPSELREWIEFIKNDPEKNDLVSLVEDLCNHETYFFRDREQISILSEYIIPEIINNKIKKGETDFNIWSAACATGEEAYTLAMLFVNELIRKGQILSSSDSKSILFNEGITVNVVGSDISRQALRVANEGAYQIEALDSFRQFPEEYLKYFTKISNEENKFINQSCGYRKINDSIKNLVNFKQFNLMSENPPAIGFDLVLCRNVFIYIDREKQLVVQDMLSRSIKKGGYLMMSPVDTLYKDKEFKIKSIDDWIIYERK